ncbi:unnamed protein product, partial [Symbiodinium microadriaticum]
MATTIECTKCTPDLPCWALPVSGCFGQAFGFRFAVATHEKNHKRALRRHEDLHAKFWDERHVLLPQATRLNALPSGVGWRCADCAVTLPALAAAVRHECASACKQASAKRPGSAKPAPKRKVRRVVGLLHRARVCAQAAKESRRGESSLPPLPPDLEYTKLHDEFCARRQDVQRLAHLSPASVYLPACLPRQPAAAGNLAVGDFVEWPGDKQSFGCIWSIDADGSVHAMKFQRRPKQAKQVCALHSEGGGCWRPVTPMKSQIIAVSRERSADFYLVPRPTDSKAASGLDGRCFQLCTTSRPPSGTKAAPGLDIWKSFVDEAVAQLLGQVPDESGNESLWTPAVQQLWSDIVCKWGTIKSRILVNSAGCFTLMAERYYCSTHERSWLLPAGNDSRGLSLGGDILGNFLIQGDYWPSALQLFQDTENFSCLERSLRDRTASTLSSAIQKHPLRAVLSDLELTVVRRAALVHCRQCPSAPTQKSWLCHWVANMVVATLAEHVVLTHGAIVSIDFSASDARQLKRARSGRQGRRTLGSVTGLNDVPLLPALFTAAEKKSTVETLLFAAFRILGKHGLRPLGLNTDDIAAWWTNITTSLQSAFPALVKQLPAFGEQAEEHVRQGGVVVDSSRQLVRGFELGQDALHVYHRLLRVVNFSSVDAVLAVRSLRKWLGSLNPSVRHGVQLREEQHQSADVPEQPAVVSSSGTAVSVEEVLQAYFHAEAPKANAHTMLQQSMGGDVRHPSTGCVLPRPVLAVLLEDLAHVTTMRGRPRQDAT